MRKVLSFVLVLSLVLGSFGMAFAAPLSDVAGKKCEDAVNVLTNLGVVSGYPDGEYKPDQVVTRAEMAVIIVRALGLADYATGTSSFSDMGGHWSNPYVAYATSLGIIDGYPDGTFRPDNTVSYDEAAKMLVAALGYTPESLTGTWPANYVVKAKSLGILDGIKAGPAGANRGDIAIMAFQTLGAKIGSTDKDGKWTANDPADTMLERLGAKLYEPDGFDPNAKTPNYAFVVRGDEDSIINLRPFLGAYVIAYANNDGDIIAIKEVKSVYLTGTYDAEDNVFETDDVDYNVPSDLLSIAHPDNVAFVNGDLVGYFDEDGDFNANTSMSADELQVLVNGEITVAAKVSGKKITEIYSLAAWVVTDAKLFEEDDLDDESLLGKDFALDDNDEIDLQSFDLVGVDSLDDIDEDNVVYVYVGPNTDKITRVAVGTEVVTGEVTKISSSGAKVKVTVGGKVYELADNEYAYPDWDDLDIGYEVEFYLDYEGYVFEVELVESEADQYAIILNAESATDNPITGKNALVELFLADGTVKVFDVAKDADESGELLKDGKWLPLEGEDEGGDNGGGNGEGNGEGNGDVVANGEVNGEGEGEGGGEGEDGDEDGDGVSGIVVEYGVDKDGVIDVITAVTLNNKKDGKVSSKGYFDGYAIASDAVIFTYDGGDKDDEDSYGVTTLAKIKGSEFDDVDYLLSSSNKIVLMVLNGEGTGEDEVYGLVTDWYKTSASDTDYMAVVLVDGEEVEYEIVYNENFRNGTKFELEPSKVLHMLKFNAKGQIVELVVVDKDADVEDTEADLLVAGKLAEKYSKGVLKVKNDTKKSRTVDPDAVAYEWDTDDKVFVVSAVTANNLKEGVYVMLYDLDEDGVVDVILFGDDDWKE